MHITCTNSSFKASKLFRMRGKSVVVACVYMSLAWEMASLYFTISDSRIGSEDANRVTVLKPTSTWECNASILCTVGYRVSGDVLHIIGSYLLVLLPLAVQETRHSFVYSQKLGIEHHPLIV